MKKRNQVRTFISLSEKEIQFIRTLQRLVRKATGRCRHPSVGNIIRGVLADYKSILEVASTPDFLQAYENAKLYKRLAR